MEQLEDIIVDVMLENDLDPNMVELEYAKQGSVKGFGTFKCKCTNSWSTARAFVKIDLAEQRVLKRYQQKCRKCERPSKPRFTTVEFEDMVQFAIDRYDDQVDGTYEPSQRQNEGAKQTPPHDSARCEKCRWGETRCWEKSGSSNMF